MGSIEDMMNMNLGKLMNPDGTLKKILRRRCGDISSEEMGVSAPLTDILCTSDGYIFYVDVPGLSKSDVQIQLEEENVVVVKSNGKRKREDREEEGCRYLKLERSTPLKMIRKFRLPQDANPSSISVKCENGVLTVTLAKVPPAKPKTVEVAIA